MSEKFHALVCDSDQATRKLIRFYLEKDGLVVHEAPQKGSVVSFLSGSDGSFLSVILLDGRLCQQDTLTFLKEIHSSHPNIPVIVTSSTASIKESVRFLKNGAFWFIEKPFDQEELRLRVLEACRSSRNTTLRDATPKSAAQSHAPQFKQVKKEFSTLGDSIPMMRLSERARKVADLESTILISGESGTGKSMLARIIHAEGARSHAPFITLSCAAIPRDLLESELFGHEKGAFTGAVSSRLGAIELAEGGTLFLDEVGDLPLELQPKLLTFLQDRTFRRVGSSREITANCRIIAATHLNLETLCREKKFREDLFYRLNVLPLQVPSLRERPDDILTVAQKILLSISRKRGSITASLSHDAAKALTDYSWPGNVRELENVLERATAFMEGTVLTCDDIELPTVHGVKKRGDTLVSKSEPYLQATEVITLAGLSLDEIERTALLQTLQACKWNKTMAATMLGISIKSIYNKMERLGIAEPVDQFPL